MSLDLKYELKITKEGEVVNEFDGEGVAALVALSNTISMVMNKKSYHNLVRTRKNETYDTNGNKVLKVTMVFNVVEGLPYTTYEYKFYGSDLMNVYNY